MQPDRKAQIRDIYAAGIDDRGRAFGNPERILKTLLGYTVPDGPILDVGCGNGAITQAVANAFPNRAITAIDLSSDQLAYAREHHAAPNISYEQADADILPDGPFAIIMSAAVVQYLADVPGFLTAAYERLLPGGRLWYSTQLVPAYEPGRELMRAVWQAFIWHTVSFFSLDEHNTILKNIGFDQVLAVKFASRIGSLTPRRKTIMLDLLTERGLTPEQADAGRWLATGEFSARRGWHGLTASLKP